MPNNKGRKRRFGSVRKVGPTEFQASYLGPDGKRRFAPHKFKRERDADRWLVEIEAAIHSRDWQDPDRARILLTQYAESWIRERPGLRPRTVELYDWLLRKHIDPYLGGIELGKLSASTIRQWRAERLAAGVSESVMAKSYRLLRSVLNTPVDPDRIISRNPCRIPGADKETPGQRPVLTVGQVFELASRVPARFRAMVLLATFGSLRFGEVVALRRCDLTQDLSWVRVSRAYVEVPGKGLEVGPPKSRAGARTVTLPESIRPDIQRHLDEFTASGPNALLFTGERDGNPVRRPNFNQRVKWTTVVANMGLAGLHFHDLRHAGNIWASKSGISTKDLMARMGHDDMRAALIYQRETREADAFIADRLSKLIDDYRTRSNPDDDDGGDGTAGMRLPAD